MEHHHTHDIDNHEHPHHNHTHGDWTRLVEWIPFLHAHGDAHTDIALETNARGIWALKVSMLGLFATAAFQVVIVWLSGSVALLADTTHNFSDALTAVPLWIAFALGKRAPNRRYTYGYGRAEDVAGVIIVGMIFLSAIVAGYESIQKLLSPEPIQHLGWVMLAAIIGFIGNEAVAIFRTGVGRAIGSAALIADGQHARVDGLTSLAVLFGALGVAAGFQWADPLIGLLITVAILFIVRDTARTMWRRLMDAVEPDVVESIAHTAEQVQGADDVHDVRVRWLGHHLHAELHIMVDEDLPTSESHRVVEEVRHALFHAQPRLAVINVHVDPCGHNGQDPHQLTEHHGRTGVG